MTYIHPMVQAALDAAHSLRHRIDDALDGIDRIRVTRPSADGRVRATVDGHGTLLDLWIAPGACPPGDASGLVEDVLSAIGAAADHALDLNQAVFEKAVEDMPAAAPPLPNAGVDR